MHVRSGSPLCLTVMLVAACFVDLGGEPGTGATSAGPSTGTTLAPTGTGDPGTGTTGPEPSTTSECGSTCCGDGKVDPGEVCDDGHGDDAFCTPVCQRAAYRVFVTKEGALLGGGLGGADGVCQSAAQTAGLPGSYRAWLSSQTVGAASRIVHAEVRPILRLDLQTVVMSAGALVGGALLAPIAVTQDGEMLALPVGCTEAAVWTGTASDGVLGVSNCDNWTLTEGGAGQAGDPGEIDESWTDAGCQVACDAQLRLYCFEVDV